MELAMILAFIAFVGLKFALLMYLED